MDIHAIRQQLKTKSIYDIPLRVTYYARVSSESDEQLNSLGNQITYYEDLIKRNAHWTFVPGYIDEGLSGISTKKLENFNRMVEEAAQNKFDLVITKEISRFARNTLDEDSELRLSIMSSIAQDELRKLSSRVKFGHQQAIKNGTVLGNSRIFGYRNHNGNKIAHTTMSNMIANPKYKGYYVGNKVKVVDMFTKKQKFLPPEEWVIFKDETGEIVPAIVDEALWDTAKRVAALEETIRLAELKKQKLLKFNALGELEDADFLSMNRECSRQIEEARQELAELSRQQDSAADLKKHMDTIRRVLREASGDAAKGIINKEFVEEFIDRIYATMEPDGSMHLKIKVFTGEVCDKYLQNLRSRTGHMFIFVLPPLLSH